MQAEASHLAPFPDFNGVARTDLPARAAFSEGAGIFRVVPAGVAVPSTTRALSELIAWAGSNRVPLIPRGAGSGMVGGNVGHGVMVDLTVLDGAPLRIDPSSRSAAAGAALTLRAMNESAARRGLRLPPDPSSARFATLGGMLSTNASGPRSVRSGSVREWVTAVEMITADGLPLTLRRGVRPPPTPTVERFRSHAEPKLVAAREAILAGFPKTRKNSSGYALDRWLASGDLLDLVVGAEGTLGVLTRAEWRLEPLPPRHAGVRAALRDTAALGTIVSGLLGLSPAAVEYLDATFLRFAGVGEGGEAGLLMVEFEGDDSSELAARTAGARRILAPWALEVKEAGDRGTLEELWSVRHAASPMLARLGDGRRSLQVVEDACVPVEAMGSYIAAVRRAGESRQIPLVIFGHAGEGNLHVNLLPDVSAADWKERVAGVYEEVSDAVIGMGGTPSGEHGDGRLRAGLLERLYGAGIVALFRLVKEAFDPAGILNPGVKLAAPGHRPLTELKVGDDAEPLPQGIEAGLREIERTAGYAQSRLDLVEA